MAKVSFVVFPLALLLSIQFVVGQKEDEAASPELFMSDFGEQFNKIITDLTFKSKVAKLDEKFKSSVGDDYDSVDRAALADEVAASPESMKLSAQEGDPIEDESLFRSIVGALQYVFTPNSKLLLEGYSDASWGSDIDDRRSTSGFFVFFGGNPVSWRSKKQQVVSRATAEVEYRSLAHVTAEIEWIQSLLVELGIE
ncbi:hypothetical protein Gogos_017382, partial [Gossypium gossypioides]|nr:hypothetical protein [Gossypium gossypioides]